MSACISFDAYSPARIAANAASAHVGSSAAWPWLTQTVFSRSTLRCGVDGKPDVAEFLI
jgi:hypothetical protein